VDSDGTVVEGVVKLKSLSVSKETVKLTRFKNEINIKVTATDKSGVVLPATYGETYKWTSNNTGVATVDQKGNITAKAEGEAKITVASKYSAKVSKTITVTVENPPLEFDEPLKLEGRKLYIYPNYKFKLSAPKLEKGIDLKSSDTSVIKVDKGGYVQAAGKGKAVLTVIDKESKGKKTFPINIEIVKEGERLDKGVTAIRFYRDAEGVISCDPEKDKVYAGDEIYVGVISGGKKYMFPKDERVICTQNGFVKLDFPVHNNVSITKGGSTFSAPQGKAILTVSASGVSKKVAFDVEDELQKLIPEFGNATAKGGKRTYTTISGIKKGKVVTVSRNQNDRVIKVTTTPGKASFKPEKSGFVSFKDITDEFAGENGVAYYRIIPKKPGTVKVTVSSTTSNGLTFSIHVKPYTDWVKDSKGRKKHYTRGKLDTGLTKIGARRYYFQKKTGYMVKGWKKIGKKKYYFDVKTGVMKTGWLKLKGKYYYLSPEKAKIGQMQTGKVKIGKKTYKFNSKGVCLNR